MRATVNYRAFSTGYFDNAYYSPPANSSEQGQIIFGQGEATDFTYDTSVTFHEYTHAVIDGTSGYLNTCIADQYGSDCTQGGLNEGSADYFSSTLRGDPAIGPYALAVSPRLYADLNRIFDDSGVLELEQVEKLARRGVYPTAVLPEWHEADGNHVHHQAGNFRCKQKR